MAMLELTIQERLALTAALVLQISMLSCTEDEAAEFYKLVQRSPDKAGLARDCGAILARLSFPQSL